jgi:hypothetical protein
MVFIPFGRHSSTTAKRGFAVMTQIVKCIALVTILFYCACNIQQAQAQEVAKPLPTGQKVFVPYGGRTEPLSPSGTPGYQFFDALGTTISVAELLSDLQPETPLPTTWGDLTSGTSNELQVLTVQQAAQFNIPVLMTNVDNKYVRKILIKSFIAYKEYPATNGGRIRMGAGVRWIMDVATLDANAQLSFPALAAQAQLNMAFAMVKIVTPGINNDAISNAANVPSDLNVENYFKMAQGFDKCISLIKSDLQIDPQVVETLAEVKSETDADYTKALLMSWTLARIAEKKKLREAQDGCPISDANAKSVIADIYRQRCNITGLEERPNDVQSAQAKALLKGMKVKK